MFCIQFYSLNLDKSEDIISKIKPTVVNLHDCESSDVNKYTECEEAFPTVRFRGPNLKNSQKVELKRKSDFSIENTDSKRRKTSPTISANNTVANIEFLRNEVVWGKIRGWPHWPARIVEFENKRIEILWFNDYRRTKVFRTQLFKFYPNFNEFAQKFSSNIGLETAAKEALLYLSANN